jgi:hypothetical protein
MYPQVERGKMAIVEHVKEVLQGYKIEPTELVFQWQEDDGKAFWNLNLYRGKERQQLGFSERELERWPESPEVAGKHLAAILSVVECLLKKR